MSDEDTVDQLRADLEAINYEQRRGNPNLAGVAERAIDALENALKRVEAQGRWIEVAHLGTRAAQETIEALLNERDEARAERDALREALARHAVHAQGDVLGKPTGTYYCSLCGQSGEDIDHADDCLLTLVEQGDALAHIRREGAEAYYDYLEKHYRIAKGREHIDMALAEQDGDEP